MVSPLVVGTIGVRNHAVLQMQNRRSVPQWPRRKERSLGWRISLRKKGSTSIMARITPVVSDAFEKLFPVCVELCLQIRSIRSRVSWRNPSSKTRSIDEVALPLEKLEATVVFALVLALLETDEPLCFLSERP